MTTFYPFRYQGDPDIHYTSNRAKVGAIHSRRPVAWVGEPERHKVNPGFCNAGRKATQRYQNRQQQKISTDKAWHQLTDKGWGNWDEQDIQTAEQLPWTWVDSFIQPHTLEQLRERLMREPRSGDPA